MTLISDKQKSGSLRFEKDCKKIKKLMKKYQTGLQEPQIAPIIFFIENNPEKIAVNPTMAKYSCFLKNDLLK
jgi:hypothetical protein